jgi:ADP-ribose pyrophosphatase
MLPPSLQNSERLLEGVRFDVIGVDLAKRSGGTKRREVVAPPDAVVIVPVLDDGRLVLIRNTRFAIDQTLWEIPAGTLEPDEDPAACAARELEEETGYAAETLTKLLDFYASPGFCTERMTAYLAQGLTHRGQDLDETEQIEVAPVTLDDALTMLANNQIKDGKTIATLLHYYVFTRDKCANQPNEPRP